MYKHLAFCILPRQRAFCQVSTVDKAMAVCYDSLWKEGAFMAEAEQAKKEQMRQQALRQIRLEELVCRNMELTQELETLRSNNPNRRKYTLMVGLSSIFLYSLVLILAVSLLVSGDLSQMFGFFLGWTILFTAAFISLFFPIRKLRKLDKEMEAQAEIYREELRQNNQEIAALRNG